MINSRGRVPAACAPASGKVRPAGYRNHELRGTVAPLCGLRLDHYRAGQMTYDLRQLRLRGLIERIPHTQRYQLTGEGCASPCPTTTLRRAFWVRSCRPRSTESRPTRLQAAVASYDREVGHLWEGHGLAA